MSYAGAQYIYGLNGDLQTKISGTDTTKYTYDALGNLTQVVMPNGDVIQYVIDGQNRRLAKRLNGKIVDRWIYSGQLSPVAELDSSGNVISQFVGGYMIKGGNTYRLITDHLGSVRLVVDVNSGSIAERIDYDEFGNVTYDSNPGFQPFGFAGGLYDTDTKLVRFGARDYDAATGRWTSKDPLGFGGGVTNLFEYVVGDPINSIDPSGLQHWEFSQSTGRYYYVSPNGDRTYAGGGYSGAGQGINNPAMQGQENVGPTPVGTYIIGPMQDITTLAGHVLPDAMRLTPDSATQELIDSLGRTGGYIIHGSNDYENRTGSEGCPVTRPGLRHLIGENLDYTDTLRVVP